MTSSELLRRRALLLALGLVPCGASMRALAQSSSAPTRAGGGTAAPGQRNPERHAMLTASAAAGKRLVIVGEQGLVLLSDDLGTTWKQAEQVPTQAALNAVTFIDEKLGWAAGHDGTILHTRDGGVQWTLQRSDLTADRPIFGLHFIDGQRGLAVGLWSLLLGTTDGGRTWTEQKLPPIAGQSKQDRNLLVVFGSQGMVHIAGEGGFVITTKDQGSTWVRTATGYEGSLWAGTSLPDGAIVVAGMGGNAFRSVDGGATWIRIPTGTKSAITGVAAWRGGAVAVGLDGAVLTSTDGAATFGARQRSDRAALTHVLVVDGKPLALSKRGLVRDVV